VQQRMFQPRQLANLIWALATLGAREEVIPNANPASHLNLNLNPNANPSFTLAYTLNPNFNLNPNRNPNPNTEP